MGVGLITSPRALRGCPGGRDMVRKAPAAGEAPVGAPRTPTPQVPRTTAAQQEGRVMTTDSLLSPRAPAGCRMGPERVPARHCWRTRSPVQSRVTPGSPVCLLIPGVEPPCCFRLTPTPPGDR